MSVVFHLVVSIIAGKVVTDAATKKINAKYVFANDAIPAKSTRVLNS